MQRMVVACSNIEKDPLTLPQLSLPDPAAWSEVKVVDILRFFPSEPRKSHYVGLFPVLIKVRNNYQTVLSFDGMRDTWANIVGPNYTINCIFGISSVPREEG
jgi:hypothetical protein